MKPYMYDSQNGYLNSTDQKLLTLHGEGAIFVTPNLVTIQLGVETMSKTVAEAQAENSRYINLIIQNLRSAGIENDQIKTIEYTISPQYDFLDGERIFKGYKVIHMLEITTQNISQTGQLVDLSVQSGANIIRDISFSVNQPDTYYRQALTLAIRDAQLKAVTLGNTIGVSLNEIPINIKELTRQTSPQPFEAKVMATTSDSTTISAGQYKVTASVLTEFRYY